MFVVLFAVTGYVGAADPPVSAGRMERDSTGREWKLKDWEVGSRPYPKSLKEREAWYRNKWGEDWSGPTNDCRIHNPGDWQWDVIDIVPADMAARIKGKGPEGKNTWGNQYSIEAFVWAPGGEQPTDIFVTSENSFYHVDLVSKQKVFIGKPEEGGMKDGAGEFARLLSSAETTLDPVTGRLFFVQGKKTWRFVEKLLPYECLLTKKVCYLPAVLDWRELYRQVKSPFGGELKPVITDGKRGGAVFVTRTNSGFRTFYLPGARIGKRPLVTPDGKGVYLAKSWADETSANYENTARFDPRTGAMQEGLKLKDKVPDNYSSGTDGPGSHGGNCVGYEGDIFTAQHGGCCGPCGSGGGRMFSINPATGTVTMLYDSVPEDGAWKKGKSSLVDGPADALSLKFTSTLWQVQCPRTGAIINGGWDNTGIRRYHDGFVTSIVHSAEPHGISPRPGWNKKEAPIFYHRNCNPSVAPNGDLYIPDVKSKGPRIIRIFRTDWPKEQPVNGYAEKFMPKEKMEALMLEYAKKYIENYEENDKLVKGAK